MTKGGRSSRTEGKKIASWRERPARWTFLGLAGAASLLLILAALWPGGLELTLIPVKGGRPLLALPFEPGERFTLHYFHSVEDSPIWEIHSLDREGRIYIEEERYLKVMAGMGYLPGRGRMVQRGEYEVIEGMHWPVGEMILRVGEPGVDHTLIWRGRRFNLSARVAGQALRFQGRRISLLGSWWERVKILSSRRMAEVGPTDEVLGRIKDLDKDRGEG